MSKLILGFLCCLLCAVSFAQSATVQISKYPEAVVADGSSSVNLTIQVRDKNGSIVPDGTEVLIETNLGSVTPNLATTRNGFATATLTAGNIPGMARVNVSVIELRATTSIDVLFAKSREELSSENLTVRLSGPNRVTYSPELRIIRVDGPGKKVKLVAPGIEIAADDLQYDLRLAKVTAKRADVTIDNVTREYREMFIDIRTFQGLGIAPVESTNIIYVPKPPYFQIGIERKTRSGPVSINRSEITPYTEPMGGSEFTFVSIDEQTSLVYARRATIYPSREIHFQDASLDIQGQVVLRVPLFKVSTQEVRTIITEEFIEVANNQLNVDFPYYLALQDGGNSALRFRYGTRYGRGFGAAGGMFLDLEHSWSLSSTERGFFALQGVSRKDWGMTLRQNLQLGKTGNAYIQADFPAHRALVGNLNMDGRLGKWVRANYVLGASRNVSGLRNDTIDQSLNIRRDPIKVKGLPVYWNFGVFGSTRNFTTDDTSTFSRMTGADVQAVHQPIKLGNGTFNLQGRVAHFTGYNIRPGLNSFVNASFGSPIGNGMYLSLNYDFSDERVNASFIGKHRLSSSMELSLGRLYLSTFAAKSIDIDRYNIQGDLSYRFHRLWRVGATSTLESFKGSSYSDAGLLVAYTVGYREIGVSWSQRRNRIGIEILGTPVR